MGWEGEKSMVGEEKSRRLIEPASIFPLYSTFPLYKATDLIARTQSLSLM